MLHRGGEHAIGEVLDHGQAARRPQVTHQAPPTGVAQFARRDEFGQQMQRPFCFEIEAGFQARKDAGEQVAHAGDALDLRLRDVALIPTFGLMGAAVLSALILVQGRVSFALAVRRLLPEFALPARPAQS